MPDMLKTGVLLLAAAGAAAVTDAAAQTRRIGEPFATRSEVIAPRAMAATSQPLATTGGARGAARGGSAVDAAIAANAVLGLMEPTGSGIGGDLFAIVWDPEAEEAARPERQRPLPALADARALQLAGHEGHPAARPAAGDRARCVDGWFELHDRFGKLPMTEVLAPAIGYAREGFPVTEVIADDWQRNARVLEKYPGFARPSCRAAARRPRASCSPTRGSPGPTRRSRRRAATPSTRARSPGPSPPT